jgi:hypothetical protein
MSFEFDARGWSDMDLLLFAAIAGPFCGALVLLYLLIYR